MPRFSETAPSRIHCRGTRYLSSQPHHHSELLSRFTHILIPDLIIPHFLHALWIAFRLTFIPIDPCFRFTLLRSVTTPPNVSDGTPSIHVPPAYRLLMEKHLKLMPAHPAGFFG